MFKKGCVADDDRTIRALALLKINISGKMTN